MTIFKLNLVVNSNFVDEILAFKFTEKKKTGNGLDHGTCGK